MVRLLLAVLLSGAASLAYQVSWTRRLADETSATAQAQAIVLAVFFAGLGLGAALAGRVAARVKRPLLGYVAVELAALAAALATVPAFGACQRARAALAGAGASEGVALAGAIGVACLVLLVPTTLMGASLPFVIETAERRAGAAEKGRVVALAYGVNTLGAALGCALAGFVLVERVGLAGTTRAGAALSLAAALVALSGALPGRRGLDRPAALLVHAASSAGEPVSAAGSVAVGVLGAAAVGGLVGVGAEVVWSRLFSLLVLNTVYAFTQVLLAILIGIALGTWLSRRLLAGAMRGAPAGEGRGAATARATLRSAALAQVAAAIGIAAVPSACLLLAGRSELEADLAAGRSPLGALALVAVLVAPVALNATTLPLLVDTARGAGTARSFGAVYAANTAGSVVGSLLAGFALIPALGTTGSSMALSGASLLLASGLLLLGGARPRDAAAALIPAVGVAAFYLGCPDVPRKIYEARIPKGSHLLAYAEGVASDVMVTDADQGQRRLWINSSWVAGTGGGHRALGHLPALFVATPRRAVGIALGTGQTFAAVFANGVTDLDVVEINPDVIRFSRRWFGEANGHLFEHAGVHVHQEDGRAFLRATRERFDLVVLEPLQAWSAGTSSLYAREFYEEARRVLEPGGVVAQWIPLYGQGVDETRAMVRTALEVFPEASLWLDEHDGILILRGAASPLSARALGERMAARGLAADLATKAIHAPVDVLSLLVLGPEGLRRWAGGARLITDDAPFLEFAAARQLGEDSFVPLVRSIAAARERGRSEAAAVTGSASALEAEAEAASDGLLAEAALPERDFAARAAALEGALALAPSVFVLRQRYRSVIGAWAFGAGSAGASEGVLEGILLRGVGNDDDYGEGMLNLAVLAARRGDGSARGWAERAARIERTRASALAMLGARAP